MKIRLRAGQKKCFYNEYIQILYIYSCINFINIECIYIFDNSYMCLHFLYNFIRIAVSMFLSKLIRKNFARIQNRNIYIYILYKYIFLCTYIYVNSNLHVIYVKYCCHYVTLVP